MSSINRCRSGPPHIGHVFCFVILLIQRCRRVLRDRLSMLQPVFKVRPITVAQIFQFFGPDVSNLSECVVFLILFDEPRCFENFQQKEKRFFLQLALFREIRQRPLSMTQVSDNTQIDRCSNRVGLSVQVFKTVVNLDGSQVTFLHA